MYSLNNINRVQINNQLMIKLFHLYEEKGKSFYYNELFSKDEQTLANEVIEANIINLASYFELKLTDARIKLMSNIRRKYVSKNKDEALLNNIKSTIMYIHQRNYDFKLNSNEINDIITLLFRGVETIKPRKKGKRFDQKIITPFEELSSEGQLEKTIEIFNKIIKDGNHELLVVIFNFYVDFIMMKPFDKHNELIALIVIYALIYSNFKVCRYYSFFEILLLKKESFNISLTQARYDWEHGFSQMDSLVRIIVDTLIEVHKNLEAKKHIYIFDVKMNKQNNIEAIILNGPDVFTKNDLRKLAPLVSESTLNRTLQILRERNVIAPLGKGRSAKWQRLSSKPKKFVAEQLSLFDTKKLSQ